MALFSHQDNKWSEVVVLAQVFIRSLGISDRVPGSILLYVPVRKYRAMQSQNQGIIGPYFSYLAIIHHCKNVAIFLQGSCKNVRLVQGLILALIRPCIRVTAAIFFGYQC